MKRVDANLIPFAKNNPSGYRFAFGTDTATDDINVNYNDNIKKGWGTTPNEFPEVEDFNAMAYTSSYLTAYLYQMGISEWNNKQNYRQYSRVIGSDGIVYKAKIGTDLAPNVNNNPTTDSTNWEVDVQFNINTFTNKATPTDTDNLAIQEVGGLFKKISWSNLKATLKTYFDTLYLKLMPTIATGTATFTSTTNNINLANIGIGVEIGDVIQISGADDSKNNSEFTVEVITDSDNIIVNQAHSNKGTSKNIANRANDTGVTVKLLSKWYNATDGLGQDWVNVGAIRTINTDYPNNTRRAFKVQIVTPSTSGHTALLVSGVVISVSDSLSDSLSGTVSGVVTKGSNYRVITTTPAFWLELR